MMAVAYLHGLRSMVNLSMRILRDVNYLTNGRTLQWRKVGIRFTPNAIWEWLEYIENLGDKLGRSISQRRKKLLAGFPESFDVVTSPERLKPDPGSYVLPATYPNYHPKKGQPDPNADKPDLYALCKAFYPKWHYRIKSGQIRSVLKARYMK